MSVMIELLTAMCSLQPCYFSEEHLIMQVPTPLVQVYDSPLYEVELEYEGVTIIFVSQSTGA